MTTAQQDIAQGHIATDYGLEFLVQYPDIALLNGDLEMWTDTADAADYWAWDETQSSTLSRESGARSAGSGTYIQRISVSGPAQSLIGEYSQTVFLSDPGDAGKIGSAISASVWRRETGAGTATLTITINILDESDSVLETASSTLTMSSAWARQLKATTITDPDAAKVQVVISITSTVAGDLVIEMDDASISLSSDSYWKDYSDYLIDFGTLSFQIEERAFPFAFSSSLNEIRLDNSDGFWTDANTLDGLLVNAAEDYGRKFYKRPVRLIETRRDVAGNETSVVMTTALVRDIVFDSEGTTAVLKIISFDAIAKDQRCDDNEAGFHALGELTTPADWQTAPPADYNDAAYIYRLGYNPEDDNGTYQFVWFENRRVTDIIERTCWALDDLDYDIDTDATLYATNGLETPSGGVPTSTRDVVTTRDIPPNDTDITIGTDDNRCRVLLWNTARSVLVCCCGPYIYDLDVQTNVYTLRYTLTTTQQVVAGWYTDEADGSANDERIVLVSMDVSEHVDPSSPDPDTLRQVEAWTTTLNAGGTGAYAVLDNETSLGTDVFPAMFQSRAGTWDAGSSVRGIGQVNNAGFIPAVSYTAGENIYYPFAQLALMDRSVVGGDEYGHFLEWGSDPIAAEGGEADMISLFATADSDEKTLPGWSIYARRGFANLLSSWGSDPGDICARWSWGSKFAAALNIYTAGGRLYFFTWDSTNGYRMKWYELSTYSAGSYVALNGASTDVPVFIYADAVTADKDVYVSSMDWDDTGSSYSESRIDVYDENAATWSQKTFLSGATGSDQAWTCMEIVKQNLNSTIYHPIILFNRETMKWRVVKDIDTSWANTDAKTLDDADGDWYAKDSASPIMGLHEDRSYDDTHVYFIVAGGSYTGTGAMLYYITSGVFGGTTQRVRVANCTPWSTSYGYPISNDFYLGSNLVHTPADFPDADTPNGMLFGVSANDWGDVAAEHPLGSYTLWQNTNFYSGFVPLLDVGGLNFFELRSLLAEAFGFVHYYAPDGTFKFKVRDQAVGTPEFVFSAANGNYFSGAIQTQGWERITNTIKVLPYGIVTEVEAGEIVKADSDSTGMLDKVAIGDGIDYVYNFRVVMVTPTTFDLYDDGDDPDTAILTGQSIDDDLRGPTGYAWLSIFANNFSGVFKTGDTFSFNAYPPNMRLEQLDSRDQVQWRGSDDVLKDWHRSNMQGAESGYDNRFVTKTMAWDVADNILRWLVDPHPVVQLRVAHDVSILPLAQIQVVDSNLGFDSGDTFIVSGVRHDSRRMQTTVTATKL